MLKRALVTGVSSGIGYAQAKALLKEGFVVYGVDKAQKPDLVGDFHFLRLDVTRDLEPLFSWCDEVEVLLLTAGILDDYKPLLDSNERDLEQLLAVNLLAPIALTRFYLPKMLERQEGIIITMCSIASTLAGGGGSDYTTSKHALAGFTKQLALDYAKEGIQVFGIAPGAVKTGMTASDFQPGGLADWVANETPIKRWIEASEVADLTVFLTSGKARALQGEIITIDGGWSLK
ncbi:3-oxoacyl-ACP reductase [Streptococcus sp. zg-JUN1979]|uniref:3-oxoacyl-ACP reductase n=1 Tax=Streptococcus sp. zg-JUN1979 TaxID=3391450 RepID=UPI0039A4FCF8